MNYQIINQFNELQRICTLARQSDVVMLDTEFVRTRTFYPQLGLIQLFDGETLALIDPLAIEDMSPFMALLQDVSVLKVLHACGEDLEVFQHRFGCVPFPMVDTQLMAAFTGYGLSTGFAALVQDLLTVTLDKSESRTDWLARPLSQKQLDYAAADVFYLLPMYEQLLTKVRQMGWWDAAQQESLLQIEKRTRVTDPENVYLDIKGAWQLNRPALAILKPLATWRYQEAMKRDLALNFVIREHDLLTIARLALHSPKRMEEEGIDPHVIRRHGAKISLIVKEAKQIPAQHYPALIVPLMDHPGYKQLFKKLKDEVKGVSQISGLSTEFLASKKQLNQLVNWVWNKGRDPECLPELMQGWRLPLLGERLNNLIK
ncbi:ribonuclease D [Vibrio sp. V27_P1S3P104]|nr:ribonuclease D [Vibrio sp. V28_P6S34P95]NAX05802.1 ribonuclease D [Vibrio sp. V30_P3S12P165]NAX34605.1 ribonuclease D [Vibrio sp. V29_P1S30P107]NAX38329.1 ribonuclease D [Vibrio sp. V27_P1S3P104]